MPTFAPPTTDVPFRGLLERWNTVRGVTVWKQGGVWYRQQEPFWGNADATGVKDADIVAPANRPGGERTDNTDRDRYLFFGGHVYTVSSAIAAELTAEGYVTIADPAPSGPVGPFTWETVPGTWAAQTLTWAGI